MPTLPTISGGVVYNGQFKTNWNGEEDTVIIEIAQKETFQLDSLSFLADLNDDKGRLPEGALSIKIVDNNEEPFTAIKAKQATIKFFSDNGKTLKSFAKGESDEWFVTIYLNYQDINHVLFKGFLVMDLTSEPYEPKPYVVELTATDNLGILKNIALTDFNGNNPKNENKIIDYLAWALSKTNLSLPIYVANNLFEENNPNIPFYESCYLDAKTFEKTIGESEDCNTVIQKILGNNSRITQRNGAWWIESVYEKNQNPQYVHQFDYDGTYVGVAAPAYYHETIDNRGLIDFVNDNAQVTIRSPYKRAELTFNYEYPTEIIDNIDFSRGLTPIGSPTFNGTDYVQKYEVEDWTIGRYAVNNENSIASSTVVPYIVKLFQDSNLTYEKERYVVVPFTNEGYFTDSLPFTYLRSNRIFIEQKDKGTISLDFKYSVDTVGDHTSVFGLILKGDSGDFWVYGSSNQWINTSVYGTNHATLYQYFAQPYTYTNRVDKIRWSSLSIEFPPVPESGELFVYLSAGYNQGGTGNPDAHYTNLRFDYVPYLNGSYSKYTGQKNTVSQSGTYSLSYQQPIYISDSPKKLFKGALLRKDGTKYLLAKNFYDGQAFPSGLPSFEYVHTFGFQLTYAVWQLYRRHMASIDSDFIGLKLAGPATVPDVYKSFIFTNPNPHVNNKYFMLLYYEQDLDSQIWRAYLTENLDTTIGYVFTDPYEFKYITG